MKHPVLTRLFSIALAIVSLIMFVAGALGVGSAREDRQDTLDSYNRLQGRIEEYETVTQALEGTISYEEANEALQELQDQHDSDASQHKSDLALYTATKGGVSTGVEAIEQGEEAIAQAWDQYDAGLAMLKEQEEQLNEGAQALEGLLALSGETQRELDIVLRKTFAAFPGADQDGTSGLVASTLAAVTLSAAPGGTESGPDEGTGGADGANTDPAEGDNTGDGEPGSGGEEGTDPGGSEGGTNPGGGGTESGGGGGTESGGGGTEPGDGGTESGGGGGTDPGDNEETGVPKEKIQAVYGDLIAAYGDLASFFNNANKLLGELNGMDGLPEEQKAQIGAFKQMIAGYQSIPVGPDQLQAALKGLESEPNPVPAMAAEGYKKIYDGAVYAYTEIQNSLGGIGGALTTMSKPLTDAQAQLEGGRAAIAAAKEQLAKAREALEAGDAQLYSGWAQLQKTLNDLDGQADDLEQEKETLEQEAADLEAKKEEVRQQKDLEKRQTSLKVLLLDREGIQERCDGGMELLDSARDYGSQLLRDADRTYRDRLIACVLMIVGGLAGLAGILPAFEKLKGRALLIAPVVLCLACAAGAECIFEFMGRGSSYSAIFAGIFALVQLLVILPKAKKPGQRA